MTHTHPCLMCALRADTRRTSRRLTRSNIADFIARSASLGLTADLAGDHDTGPDPVARDIVNRNR